MEIFHYDDLFYKKKLLQRMSIIGIIYFAFLSTNYLSVPNEQRIEFLKIFLPVSALLVFFFYRNFQKQLKIVKEGKIELDGMMLRQFSGSTGQCLEVDLNEVKSISKDRFKSYTRILMETEENEYTFLNLAEMEKFEDKLKNITSLEILKVESNLKDILKRSLSFYLPSFVCAFLVFYPTSNWDIQILFLVININSIFFLKNLSDYNLNSSLVTISTIRKTIYILIISLFMQIFFFIFNWWNKTNTQ